ncbi:hypothetical protein [Sinorhizobium medicae]
MTQATVQTIFAVAAFDVVVTFSGFDIIFTEAAKDFVVSAPP